MPDDPKSFVSTSPAETKNWGEKLGECLLPQNVVILIGKLGAGKTCLVKGLASGLGIKNYDIVHSPSFKIINSYNARYPIYHIDLYRVKPGEEVLWECAEFFQKPGVSLIEWPEIIIPFLPSLYGEIQLTWLGANKRKLEIVKWPFPQTPSYSK